MARFRLLVVLVALAAVVLAPPPAARGFSVYGTGGRLTVERGGEDWATPRWDYPPGTLLRDNVRGLDGGIEYAVADDYCERLIPNVVDVRKPTCQQLKDSIRNALDQWAEGHPTLRFTDVTGQLSTSVRSREEGAELEFHAGTVAQYPALRGGVASYANTLQELAPNMRLTSGRYVRGVAIVSADVVLNQDVCWFFDHASQGQTCIVAATSYQGALLHEVGHVLGLAHPHTEPHYDDDDNPTNLIAFDCEDPTKGLRRSAGFERNAIMSYVRDRVPTPRLMVDDVNGRNFLYPTGYCPSDPLPPLPPCPDTWLARLWADLFGPKPGGHCPS